MRDFSAPQSGVHTPRTPKRQKNDEQLENWPPLYAAKDALAERNSMYYSFYEAEEPLYFRDLTGIREELEEAKRCLYRGSCALSTAEELSGRLALAFEHGGDERYVPLLDAVSETGDDLKREASELKTKLDALFDEMEETLFWFKGSACC